MIELALRAPVTNCYLERLSPNYTWVGFPLRGSPAPNTLTTSGVLPNVSGKYMVRCYSSFSDKDVDDGDFRFMCARCTVGSPCQRRLLSGYRTRIFAFTGW